MEKPFAVVTSSSSGIRIELAKEFARNGYDLLVTSTGPIIETAAEECRITIVSG